MITGIDLTETQDFVCPDDKENPTVWKLGIIPSGVLACIGGSDKDNPIQVALKMLQIGVKGWSNFAGVDFKTEKKEIAGLLIDMVPIDLVNRIPISAIMAISEALANLNHLSDAERKN